MRASVGGLIKFQPTTPSFRLVQNDAVLQTLRPAVWTEAEKYADRWTAGQKATAGSLLALTHEQASTF